MSLRDLAFAKSPSWLRGPVGQAIMYSMAVQFDAIEDLVSYAVRARFPDLAPPDAYHYLTLDRNILQGFQETIPSWLARCKQWLQRWSKCGSPQGLLMGVRAVFNPCLLACWTVTPGAPGPLGSAWDEYAAGVQDSPTNPPTHTGPGVQAWTWDNTSGYHPSPALNRVFVVINCIIASSCPWTVSTHTWNDGATWDGGQTWDVNDPSTQIGPLLAAVQLWKSKLTSVPCVILTFLPGDFSLGGGGAQPDGNYGTWSKLTNSGGRTTRVPSRYAGAAYLAGVS